MTAHRATDAQEPVNDVTVSAASKYMPNAEGKLTRSLGWMVTRLAWMAAELVSSKRETRYASDASWRAITADDWKRRSVYKTRQ